MKFRATIDKRRDAIQTLFDQGNAPAQIDQLLELPAGTADFFHACDIELNAARADAKRALSEAGKRVVEQRSKNEAERNKALERAREMEAVIGGEQQFEGAVLGEIALQLCGTPQRQWRLLTQCSGQHRDVVPLASTFGVEPIVQLAPAKRRQALIFSPDFKLSLTQAQQCL